MTMTKFRLFFFSGALPCLLYLLLLLLLLLQTTTVVRAYTVMGADGIDEEGEDAERGNIHTNIRKNPVVKMYVLAGADNMQGHANVGHLQYLYKELSSSSNNNDANATTNKKQQHNTYDHLMDPLGNWLMRDDVHVIYQDMEGDGENEIHFHAGGLLVSGYGATISQFGPETEFGHVMGNVWAEPVILVKAAWENVKLTSEFCPPSACPDQQQQDDNGQPIVGGGGGGGPAWRRMMETIEYTKNHLGTIFNDEHYDKASVDLEGLVWWQGYPDLQDPAAVMEYQETLVHFVRDFRQAVDNPYLWTVIGELGGHGVDNASTSSSTKDRVPKAELEFRQMQREVVDECGNWTTSFVETARYVKTRSTASERTFLDEEPAEHYYGRADTMIAVGRAFAMSLLEMSYTKGWNDNQGEQTKMSSFLEGWDMSFRLQVLAAIGASLTVLLLCLACRRRGGINRRNVSASFQDVLKCCKRQRQKGHSGLPGDDNDEDDGEDGTFANNSGTSKGYSDTVDEDEDDYDDRAGAAGEVEMS